MPPTVPVGSYAERLDAFRHARFPYPSPRSTAAALGSVSALRPRDDGDSGFVAIPSTYGSQHSSPSPGIVAAIVLGSVAGFLFLLFLLYSALGFGPVIIPYRRAATDASTTDDGTATMASRSVVSIRARDMYSSRRAPRATETVEVRTRDRVSSARGGGGGGRPIIVEPRRDGPRSAPPPPRVVPPDDDDSDDEIVVMEEPSTPPRRKSTRASTRGTRSRYSDYQDAESRRY